MMELTEDDPTEPTPAPIRKTAMSNHAQPTAQPRPTMASVPFEPHDEVRIGLIGASGRQASLMRSLAPIPGVRVVAVSDDSEVAARKLAERLDELGHPGAVVLAGRDDAADQLCARDDVDLVMVATPWDSHASMAVKAMRAGKHVAVEVPAAVTLEECWELVDTSEETRRHCVILENCCYGRTELLALQLVRAGALGQLLHAECSYTHDLRAMLLESKQWRRQAHIERDGNLYPTHGLGPVASCFGINRGDRFTRLVSMGSPSLGLQEWRAKHLPADDPRQQEDYICADINTSLLQTEQGRTVVLQHQVVGPRPYDRRNQIVGTNGIIVDYPPRIFLEDDPLRPDDDAGGSDESEMAEREEFGPIEPYEERFGHPLLASEGETARRTGGHGGMDYLMLLQLVQAMQEGAVPDMDVYDAATWTAAGPLSEQSVAGGNVPVEFPDFTRGRWQEDRPGMP